jgi:hypothetical protein
MFLKELESWLERGQNVPFLREICPPKKYTPNIGANIGAITGILLKDASSLARLSVPVIYFGIKVAMSGTLPYTTEKTASLGLSPYF